MKKKVVVVLTAALLINSITLPVYKIEAKEVASTTNYGFAYNKINFETVKEAEIPVDLAKKIQSNKEKKGFLQYADSEEGYIYIAILGGVKEVGGYTVTVLSVEDCEGRTNVTVKEGEPKGTFYTQVITTPYTVIRAKGITTNITVKDQDQQKYDELGLEKESTSITTNKLQYEILNEDQMKEWMEQYREEVLEFREHRGFYVLENEKYSLPKDYVYVLISSGMKPSTGYEINVASAEDIEGRSIFTIQEIAPAKEDVVGEMITYPYKILRFKQGTPRVDVYTTDGAKLNELFAGSGEGNKPKGNWKQMESHSDVEENKQWKIHFNKEIEDRRLTDDFIYVLDEKGNKVVENMEFSKNKKTVLLTPINQYEKGKNYTLYICSKNSSYDGYYMKFKVRE